MTMVGGVRREVEIMAGAGIIAGLVYWLIAGRNAGAWRVPPLPRRQPPPVPSNCARRRCTRAFRGLPSSISLG